MNRENNGRNLKLIEFRMESILYNFNKYLNNNKENNPRKLNIIKYEIRS